VADETTVTWNSDVAMIDNSRVLLVTVKVQPDAVFAEAENLLRQCKRRAVAPGFRAGRVPIEMLRKRFWGQSVRDAVRLLVDKSADVVMREALKAREFKVEDYDDNPIHVMRIGWEALGIGLAYDMSIDLDRRVKSTTSGSGGPVIGSWNGRVITFKKQADTIETGEDTC
jgi:hypothetical protein